MAYSRWGLGDDLYTYWTDSYGVDALCVHHTNGADFEFPFERLVADMEACLDEAEAKGCNRKDLRRCVEAFLEDVRDERKCKEEVPDDPLHPSGKCSCGGGGGGDCAWCVWIRGQEEKHGTG